MRDDVTIAVTGLNATDNPGPGVAVLRALRAAPDFHGRLVGLAYDSLDSGIYHRELRLTGAFLIPYPSQGLEVVRERLLEIHAQVPFDVLIPTLDSELPSMIALEPELKQRGVHLLVPSREQFDLRSKARLTELGERAGLEVPETRVLSDVRDLYAVHEDIPYPFMVKGVFYGAERANSVDEAVHAWHQTVARWGLPVIVQKHYVGQEYDIVAVGDGQGGLVGAVPMKKMFLTDKGKGWAGVAVKDPSLLELTSKFMAASKWRGPCEVEVLRTHEGRSMLLEVNPRFPAWSFLSAGAGQNLPWAVARLALGERVEPMRDFRAGTMFVRISLDQVTTIDRFERIASTGALLFDEATP